MREGFQDGVDKEEGENKNGEKDNKETGGSLIVEGVSNDKGLETLISRDLIEEEGAKATKMDG